MVHTGFVAEVQGEEKRLVNRGDFFEEFSICPVRTGDEPGLSLLLRSG